MIAAWAVAACLGCLDGPARAADPPPVLTIRVARPDEQLRRLIGLFEGSRASDPAAALAAWTRAARKSGPVAPASDPDEAATRKIAASRKRATEAIIAALNPGMIAELAGLDGAEVVLGPAEDGRIAWRAAIPNDDGALVAVATALVLSGGSPGPPAGGAAVDRIGPPGSPWMARTGAGLFVASSRPALESAIAAGPPAIGGPMTAGGWTVRFDPEAVRGSPAGTRLRQLSEAARGLGPVEVVATLEGEALIAESVAANPTIAGRPACRIDPSWADFVPGDAAAAILAAVDPGADSLDAIFRLIDRVEKADPSRSGVAPGRLRLNALAAASRVNLETDLWPGLRGVTVVVLPDRGFAVALHAIDPAAAGRIESRVVARLAERWGRRDRDVGPGRADVPVLGMIGKNRIEATRAGSTVLVGSGAVGVMRDAAADPDHSAGAAIRATWGATPPTRAGRFWPARLPEIGPEPGSPLAKAFSSAEPISWVGRDEGGRSRDVLRWGGLRSGVRRLLESLPLDPPPDRPGLHTPAGGPP